VLSTVVRCAVHILPVCPLPTAVLLHITRLSVYAAYICIMFIHVHYSANHTHDNATPNVAEELREIIGQGTGNNVPYDAEQ